MKQTILTPCLLILVGIVALNILPIYVGGGLIILGIVMLVERRWPEQMGSNDIDKKEI